MVPVFLNHFKIQLRIVLSRPINVAHYHYRSNRQHANKINSRSFLNLCVCQLDGRPLQSVASGTPPFGEDIPFSHPSVFLHVLYVRWTFLRQRFSRPFETDTPLKHKCFSGYHIEINFLLPEKQTPPPKQTITDCCCLL